MKTPLERHKLGEEVAGYGFYKCIPNRFWFTWQALPYGKFKAEVALDDGRSLKVNDSASSEEIVAYLEEIGRQNEDAGYHFKSADEFAKHLKKALKHKNKKAKISQ
jgi:hypothetical protein